MSAMDVAQYRGIIPPILTPVQPDGQVDLLSLTRLTNWLIREGVHGIWACGTTGEFPCFDADERENVVGTCAEAAMGRVPLVANISDCSTRLAIEHGLRALRAGADAVALTPPYYYSNTQEELLTHYRVVRDAVDAPLFVYNIPSRTKVRAEVETIVGLAAEGAVAGIKDSQGDFAFGRALVTRAAERGAALRVMMGTMLIDTAVQIGADGAIPGVSNVAPADCVAAYAAATAGDWAAAADAVHRVGVAAGLGGGVAGVGGLKALLKAQGILAHSTLTAPFRSPSPEDEARIARALEDSGRRIPVGAA